MYYYSGLTFKSTTPLVKSFTNSTAFEVLRCLLFMCSVFRSKLNFSFVPLFELVRFHYTSLWFFLQHYCYSGLEEFDATYDSDEETDFTKMDMVSEPDSR